MTKETNFDTTDHFKGKEAAAHLAEKRAKGTINSAEVHGTEASGHISAFSDSIRETGAYFLLFWLFLDLFTQNPNQLLSIIVIFGSCLLIWKTGRSAWLGWSRLERMHRIVEQERWEIKNNRQQEKEELEELYSLKGFQGELLNEVVEVLMADDDRLLRVMVEEELCLSLESQEHPLKQALGAFCGVVGATCIAILSLTLFPASGLWTSAFISVAIGSIVSAHYEKNELIPAVTWNLGILAFTALTSSFLISYLR